MAHDDKHKSKHAIGGEDLLNASDLTNDSTVTGASIAAALNTLKDSIVAESIWDAAAGAISPQNLANITLDFSGIGANPFTIKVPSGQDFVVDEGGTKFSAGSGSFGNQWFGNINFGKGDGTECVLNIDCQSDTAANAGVWALSRRRDSGGELVSANDTLGAVRWLGSDGSNFINAAAITAEVDGTPGTNDMPGRIRFLVTPDGGNTLAEAARIDNTGKLDFSSAANSTVIRFKHYAQAAQPALSNNGEMAMWEDTDDNNRSYLIIRTNAGDKKVELS